MLAKHPLVIITIIGFCCVLLGSVTWASLAVTGLILLAVGFTGGIMKLLSTRGNPKVVAMALNFFLPGLGFVYCERIVFYVTGAILFIGIHGPPLSQFTIPSIIATVITNLSALDLHNVVLSLLLNSVWAVLAYFFAAKFKPPH